MLSAIVLVLLVKVISASKILVIIGTPSYSHQLALRPLWQELSLRGHTVTLAITDPINDPNLVNLTEIDMRATYTNPTLQDVYTQIPIANKLKILDLVNECIDVTLEFQLTNYLQHLIKKENLFDLVITEHLYVEYLAFGDIYKCPTAIISSFDVSSLTYGYMGNPTNPSAYPDFILPVVSGNMVFTERLKSFLFINLYYVYKLLLVSPRRHRIMQKYFGDSITTVETLVNNVDLLLINTNPILYDIRPLGPNTITFGGGNHLSPPKPLPADLQEYLDSADNGFIYFSLGSNSKSMYMGMEKIEIIMNALSELPYKVLWKFETDDMITPPKNIKLVSWAPQQDILRHPNIKLFITQGGLQSLEESILCHVPMVTMPMYGDQEANSKRMEYRGISKEIPHKPLPRKDEFKNIILEVINNPIYKQNIVKAAELLVDTPMSGVDKAVWWIEYVIRHKGAKHLRSPLLDIPFYQYYCLDVISFLLVILYIFLKLIMFVCQIIKKIIKYIRAKSHKKKKE